MEMNQGLPLWRWTKASSWGEDPCVDTKASACSCDYLLIFPLWVARLDWLDWPIGQTILRVRCAWERRIGGCPRGFVTNRVLPGCYLLFTLVCWFPLFCVLRSSRVLRVHRSLRTNPWKSGPTHIIWYQSSRLTRIWFVFPPNFSSFLRNSKISTKNSPKLLLDRSEIWVRFCKFWSIDLLLYELI